MPVLVSLRCKDITEGATDARPGGDQGGADQSGADPDGMRRAVSEGDRRAAARTQRHALSQRPQPAIRGARRALVRRRRHAARLPSRERPRQLPQPLGPHPEMAGRARRRPRAVRRLRPQAAGYARRRSPQDGGVANTNIIFHAGRLLALEEGHLPTEIEPGTLQPARLLRLRRRASPAPSPRIPRSIPSPARWCSSATTPRAR